MSRPLCGSTALLGLPPSLETANISPMDPPIVHVGLHKTGSTWLQKYVFPSVRGAIFGNDQVFATLLRNMTSNEPFHEKAFRAAIEGTADKVLLSRESLAAGSPWGTLDADTNADKLARVAPDARIILFTRERSSLTRALYAQYVHEGGYYSRDVFERKVLSGDYLDFEATVERWRKRFDRVLLLRHEELRDDPGACLQKIGDFADIRLWLPETCRTNVSLRGWRLHTLRAWNRAFRVSEHNPGPLVPLPGAALMRRILQR